MLVMVTGATGQVGGALLKTLGSVFSVDAVSRDQLNLAHPGQIASELDRISPDLIINPAAYTAVDRAEDEREMAFRINAEAPGIIARWAADHYVPLIHFSTDYVFDGTSSSPWREDDLPNPLSIYGASKLAGEEAVRSAGGPHLVVRTSWVYAAKGTNFLRTIARFAQERRELRIVTDQIGAPTSARLIAEVVAAIVYPGGVPLADRFAASQGVVNVTASGETNWYGFAAAIVEGLKARGVSLTVESIVPVASKDHLTKARRPANSCLDLTRLRRVFSINPPPWDQALSSELDQLADELTI